GNGGGVQHHVRAISVTAGAGGNNASADPVAVSEDYLYLAFSNKNSDTRTHPTTITIDAAPTVVSYTPADGQTSVSTDSDITLTFSEAVNVYMGNITIYKSSDDSVFEAIDVTSAQVTGGGTTEITINPSSDLAGNTQYYVKINQNAFDDTAGVSYVGISDTTTLNFTTLVDGIVEGVEYATTSGINGLTGQAGQFSYLAGDDITFKVGGVILGTATADDVASGKTFLQDIADVDRTDLNDEYLENMAVFLQSLDENDNADDGIVISQETREALADASLDLRTATEEEVQQLVERIGATYVNEEDAMVHVRDMLIEHTDLQEDDFQTHISDDSTRPNIDYVIGESAGETIDTDLLARQLQAGDSGQDGIETDFVLDAAGLDLSDLLDGDDSGSIEHLVMAASSDRRSVHTDQTTVDAVDDSSPILPGYLMSSTVESLLGTDLLPVD
ncbi:MAG: hypothetical protein DSY87_00775, partial [Methylococcus sp.]